jgi:hypothetical protein
MIRRREFIAGLGVQLATLNARFPVDARLDAHGVVVHYDPLTFLPWLNDRTWRSAADRVGVYTDARYTRIRYIDVKPITSRRRGTLETGNVPGHGRKDDWDRARLPLEGNGHGPACQDDVGLQADQLLRERSYPIGVTAAPPKVQSARCGHRPNPSPQALA